MKSVLMIAYRFPPEGNAGAYRPLRFIRHMGEYGWRADVITSGGEHYERYDPDLLRQIPPGCRVSRIKYFDPWQSLQRLRAQRRRKPGTGPNRNREKSIVSASSPSPSLRSYFREKVRRLEALIYHPDLRMCWIRPAVEAGLKATRLRHYDAIWATGAPWSSFIVASRISELTGIPYVLDFRSSWTLVPNDFEKRRPQWIQERDQKRLAGLFERARAVVFFYETEAECFWRMYRPQLDLSRIHIIPNGFDGEIDCNPLPEPGDRCRVLYAGVLSSYRYDTLLKALAIFKKRNPTLAGRLLFEFVGEGSAVLQSQARDLGIQDQVCARSPIPHSEVRKLEQQSHALLMLGRGPDHVGFELLAGAKLFAYLRAGRPIVGVLPDDEARKVLLSVGTRFLAGADSPVQIAAMLENLVTVWERGDLSECIPDPDVCRNYSAHRQTNGLIRALENRPPATPFVPGRSKIPLSVRDRVIASSFPHKQHNRMKSHMETGFKS